jgi:hypothetical protein
MNTETVQIPGRPTFGRTYAIPSISVGLPLEVRTSASLQFLYALFSLAAGAVGILVVAVVIWLLVSHPTEGFTWIVAGCLPFSLIVAVSSPISAWISFKDAMRSDPVLIVRADGIEDRRAATMIPWTMVSQACIVYSLGNLNSVNFTLRTLIRARHNTFRVGAMGYPWYRRPDTLRVLIVLLNVRSYILAQVVATLVKRHGGEITVIGGPMLPT